MRYEFHPEAEQELNEAASRYNAEVAELGLRFADEVDRVSSCCLSVRNQVRGWMTTCDISYFANFRSPSSTHSSEILFTFCPLLTEVASRAIGAYVCKIVNRFAARNAREDDRSG